MAAKGTVVLPAALAAAAAALDVLRVLPTPAGALARRLDREVLEALHHGGQGGLLRRELGLGGLDGGLVALALGPLLLELGRLIHPVALGQDRLARLGVPERVALRLRRGLLLQIRRRRVVPLLQVQPRPLRA